MEPRENFLQGLLEDLGARDWTKIGERIGTIVHLFRAMHARPEAFGPPEPPSRRASSTWRKYLEQVLEAIA